MKKSRGVVVLILVAILTGLFCFTAAVGFGPTGTGSAKNIKTGLDLAGGVSITYKAKESNPSSEDMSDTVYKLQKRVEQYSTEAQVYQEGSDRINVEIPGVTDANAILEELGKPGSLCFIQQTGDDGENNFQYDANSDTGYSLTRDLDEIRKQNGVVLEGTDIADATGGAIQRQNTGTKEYVVNLTLTDEGKKKFADATEANVGKQIAIVYDNGILSAPTVNEAITGGKAEINGQKSVEEAQELASYIRIGSLSLELEEMKSSVVAAQLGEKAISTSVIAGAIGLVIVILFMILAYRIPGLVAGIALVFYTAAMLITLNAFDITLTLPGIAGIILGIGMAVDANVIIYARIREEIGAGASVRSAIKAGFSKAFSAIFDGNITTLLAALVLMKLGTGTVKGFAYTLALGIVISMFTALVVSRIVINALYAVGIHDPKFYGQTMEKKPINFVGKKKLFFTISLVVILAGFVAMIDSEVTPVVEEVTGDKNVQPTKVVGTNQVTIKTRSLNLEEREALNKALVDKFGVDDSLISAESISATVSNEMRRDAIVSVIVAAILMLLYIWFRFKDICFAGSAVLALIHDVLVVLTFYAISRTSVGNTFIACMLTIVGYSINATIVIFDRIRENLHGSKNPDHIEEVVNRSITQTLTRSIYTSLTTFIMVAVLYIMGVSSVKEFAAPLMVGILCGAYSSVCITGSLWLTMKGHWRKAKVQPAAVTASKVSAPKTTAKKPSKQEPPKADPAQPKKKNRKRVQERLAAQEAANNAQESNKNE